MFSSTAAAQLSGQPKNRLYFPTDGEWESVVGSEKNDPAFVDPDLVDDLFAYVQEQKSTGILVLVDGRILIEKYFNPVKDGTKLWQRALRAKSAGKTADGKPIEDVASVQKSVTAVLVGVAIQKGRLSLDHPVSKYLKVGWSKASPAQESSITIKHLLTMTSGLKDNLSFDSPAGENGNTIRRPTRDW